MSVSDLDKYIVNKGGRCPWCDSPLLAASGEPEVAGTSVRVVMACRACQREWVEVYRLCNIETIPAVPRQQPKFKPGDRVRLVPTEAARKAGSETEYGIVAWTSWSKEVLAWDCWITFFGRTPPNTNSVPNTYTLRYFESSLTFGWEEDKPAVDPEGPICVPGDIPGLLQRCSPVLDAKGELGSGIVVQSMGPSGFDVAWGSGSLEPVAGSRLALDLTDATGRAHAVWWLEAQGHDAMAHAAHLAGGVIELAMIVRRAGAELDVSVEQIEALRRVVLHVAQRSS